MRLIVNISAFDVWELLAHDSEQWDRRVNESVLADVLNEELERLRGETAGDEFTRVAFVPSSECGLDRWLMEWECWPPTADGRIGVKCYTTADARAAVPAKVAAMLDALNTRTVRIPWNG